MSNYLKIRLALAGLFHRYRRTDRMTFTGTSAGFGNVSKMANS
jgi:hypothetical protein